MKKIPKIGMSMILGTVIVLGAIIAFPISYVEANEEEQVQIPETQWFRLSDLELKKGEFLDLVDVTPRVVHEGHVALYVPCDTQNNGSEVSAVSQVTLLQGTVGHDINTLEPVELEFIASLSDGADSDTKFNNNCLFHADIGSEEEPLTDFAIINHSSKNLEFQDRHTIAFTIAEVGLGEPHEN